MNSDLQYAFLVLLVGMITVFVVLTLVVLTGRTLIFLVNKYGPVSGKTAIKNRDFKPLLPSSSSTKSGIPKKQLAAILSTVEIVTHGKGKVTNIEKIPSK